jgi:hypothetical protein
MLVSAIECVDRDLFEGPRRVFGDQRLRIIDGVHQNIYVVARSDVAEYCRRIAGESAPFRALHRGPFEFSAEGFVIHRQDARCNLACVAVENLALAEGGLA